MIIKKHIESHISVACWIVLAWFCSKILLCLLQTCWLFNKCCLHILSFLFPPTKGLNNTLKVTMDDRMNIICCIIKVVWLAVWVYGHQREADHLIPTDGQSKALADPGISLWNNAPSTHNIAYIAYLSCTEQYEISVHSFNIHMDVEHILRPVNRSIKSTSSTTLKDKNNGNHGKVFVFFITAFMRKYQWNSLPCRVPN